MLKNAIVIAGPTASGKSALAMEIATRERGIVINADSMQVYSVLHILTARPGDEETRSVPHRLYGHVAPATAHSVASWLDEVKALLEAGAFESRRPVFVGGTGLYIRALLDGLSKMPDIPAPVRAHWRAELERLGAPALHAQLARVDRDAAGRIRPTDGQRIVRAMEVHEASGRPISDWQSERGVPLVDRNTASLHLVMPDRADLHRNIDARFDRMIGAGALEEVEALGALRLEPALPVMKAIGVRELKAALDGEVTMAEAIANAKAATRRYAKRQSTWFRGASEFG